MSPEDLKNGFGTLYEPEPNTGCWLWIGSNIKGYAYARVDGSGGYVHRFLWEYRNGPIPDGMFACHACDTPGCVNPYHIFIGTPEDNMNDRDVKNRNAFGERNGRAKLTCEDVKIIRRLKSQGLSYGTIRNLFFPNVAESSVKHAGSGRTWKHVDNG